MNQKNDEREDRDITIRRIEQKHETLRWFFGCVVVASVICSIVWAIAICQLEYYKHPIQVENKVESSIQVNRK